MRARSVFSSVAVCIFLFGPAAAFGAATPNRQTDVIQTSKGPLRVTPIFHGSLMLEFDGKIIHVDPWSQADYTGFPQADLILSTHTHADHMDSALINKLKKPSTILVMPPAEADTLNGSCGVIDTISNGEKKEFLGIEIEAVPMYNLVRGAKPGEPYHHKGIGNGYILTFGDTRVYISGDTECTPEMKALQNITVAFVCMNPPRTMSNIEAAACVKDFRPKIVYPYHYRGQNTQEFADALKGMGIEVRLRKLEGEP
jgi:L-ascorbate metabolism protein UlaG (beta-lactamase superfamily)